MTTHPQHPDDYKEYPHRERILGIMTTVQIEVPTQLTTEAILIGERARGKHNQRLRDTCREFLGRGVPTLPPLPKEGYAICSECGEEKLLRDFYPNNNPHKKNGRASECSDCHKARKRLKRKRDTLERMEVVAQVVMREVR